MRLRHSAAFLLVGMAVASGCGEAREPDPRDGTDLADAGAPPADAGNACVPACAAGHTCVDGTCRPPPVSCRTSGDCPAQAPVCDAATLKCVSQPGCSCATWEVCSSGRCVAASGRCNADTDCGDRVCNKAEHVCADSWCPAKCGDWQICRRHDCVALEGRCATAAECPSTAPLCTLATHTCEPPPVAEPWAPPFVPGLIVTSEALRVPFERLALLHSLTGVPTRVVTVEQICAAAGAGACIDTDPAHDKARAIKDYLKAQYALEIVVLAGDLAHVPSRLVHDYFANTIYVVEFEEDFYTDYYFADFSEWDRNRDGKYADDAYDRPDYIAEIGVSRIPVSTVQEAETYIAKVQDHLTGFNLSRLTTALFVTNVATTLDVAGMPVNIDSATYFEMDGRTNAIVPASWTRTKLYASLQTPGSEPLTLQRQVEEMERSHTLILHSGHGGRWFLTGEALSQENDFTSDDAFAMRNTDYPFFFSGACDAGKFQFDDAAGVKLMKAPAGGAIGYLGNSATGLGLAGGQQFIDEVLRFAFARTNPLVGHALVGAHAAMPREDGITFNVPWVGPYTVSTVDKDSYEWTQKSVTFLGDALIPLWNDPALRPAATVTAARETFGAFARLNFTFPAAVTGTLTVSAGGALYRVEIADAATATLVVPGAPARITYGFAATGALPAFVEKTF